MPARPVRPSLRVLLCVGGCLLAAWAASCMLDHDGKGPELAATGGAAGDGGSTTSSTTTDIWPTTTTTTGVGGQGGSGGEPLGGTGGAGGATTTTTTNTGTLGLGEECTGGGECQSGYCSYEQHEGTSICCTEACMAPCHSCFGDATGNSDGTCAPIAYYTDPYADCPYYQYCDGVGACRSEDGQACSSGANCLSGYCPEDDLVCCDEACDGLCEGCLGHEVDSYATGTCGDIYDWTDPEHECPDSRTCNGNGQCRN